MQNSAIQGDAPQAKNNGMKAERDRFVALAFCWADLLFELDADFNIVFAAGATAPVMGRKADDLTGRNLADVIAPSDMALVKQLLKVAEARGRVENVTVRLKGVHGPTPPLSFAGYNLPDLGGHYFIAMRMAPAQLVSGLQRPVIRDQESGLFDGESFAEIAANRLKASKEKTKNDAPGEEVKVTMMALPGFDELRGRLDEDGQKTLMNTIGAALRANSLGGDAAARIADDRYSLIHKAEVDIVDLEQQIAEFAREIDPEKKGIKVESATLQTDDATISDEDLAKGLMYTINKFRESKGSDFTIRSLSTSLSTLVTDAVGEVNSFKRVVADKAFTVAFQPIIHLTTGEIHHFEALCRVDKNKDGESPYQFITFAEETGLIHDFDIAMARKVIDWLNKFPRNVDRYRVAVNISGHSVGNLTYVAELHKMLRENDWVKGKLMFEITESSRMTDLETANGFIQSLRKEGYHVCLDDFGAGAASFQYLSALDVDVVKLDGSAVRNAQKAPKGRAFLSALAELCNRLGVETIAEMVDDPIGLEFVRECGVDYVQGFLFGKPSANVKDFEPLPHLNLFPGHPKQTQKRA